MHQVSCKLLKLLTRRVLQKNICNPLQSILGSIICLTNMLLRDETNDNGLVHVSGSEFADACGDWEKGLTHMGLKWTMRLREESSDFEDLGSSSMS